MAPLKGSSKKLGEGEVCAAVFQQIVDDLGLTLGRDVQLSFEDCTRTGELPSSRGTVQISFKLLFENRHGRAHGACLIPLPEAITLANVMMMVPDDTLKAERKRTTLDETLKAGILEIGNFIGAAVDRALEQHTSNNVRVRGNSCQGVPPGSLPAVAAPEQALWIVARSKLALAPFPAFDATLVLPAHSLRFTQR